MRVEDPHIFDLRGESGSAGTEHNSFVVIPSVCNGCFAEAVDGRNVEISMLRRASNAASQDEYLCRCGGGICKEIVEGGHGEHLELPRHIAEALAQAVLAVTPLRQ